MPKYEVLATQHCYLSLEVEANSELEAIQIASDTDISLWSNNDNDVEIHEQVTQIN